MSSSECIPIYTQFTLILRTKALDRIHIKIDSILKITGVDSIFSKNSDLICIGPFFGIEAFEKCSNELSVLGLIYFDDYFELNFITPDWCELTAGLSENCT